MRKIKVVYVFGPDGSGKTTIAKKIVEYFKRNNLEVAYRWMRFNHMISKLVNGIGYVTGLSQKIRYDKNVFVGYHYYHKSFILSWLYISSTILDLFLVYPIKILWPLLTKRFLILDRFIYDILVDLMIDTEINDLYKRWPGKILRRILPTNCACYFLQVDIDIINTRRPDTTYDMNFRKRCDFYKKICKEFSLDIVDNNLPIEFTVNNILEKIKV